MAYSTTWHPIDATIGTQSIADVSTTKNHEFGFTIKARETTNGNGVGTFMYVKGVTNGARGSWVGINIDDGSITLATANGIYPLMGVMMSDLDATTDYGWVQIEGKAVAKALADFADNADVYLTGTAGSVDDTDVAGDFVSGAKGASAIDIPETGMAEFEIHRPFTRDGLDN